MGNDDILEVVIVRINQIDSNGAGILHHDVIDLQNRGKPYGVHSLYVMHITVA